MIEQLELMVKLGAGLSIFAMGLVMVLAVFWRKMTEERLSAQRVNGEVDIIDNLRQELARFADNNAALSSRLSELHQEVEKLRTENAELRAEIVSLTTEVKRLRES